MCLAVPAQIIKVLEDERAVVSLGGIEKEISIALLDRASAGDYVILHVGYALTRLDEDEAQKTLALFAEMMQGESI